MHAQEAERGGQAREEDRLKVHPQRFDDGFALRFGPDARGRILACCFADRWMHTPCRHCARVEKNDAAATRGDRQQRQSARMEALTSREPDPAAEPNGRHDRQCDDEHDGEGSAESPRQQHEHQCHYDEACRHQDLEIAQRHFHERLVEDHLTGDPHVDAGKALPSLAGEPVHGFGYLGPFEQLVLAG